MDFEKETLAVPSVEELRAKFRALAAMRNILAAGVVLSLTAMGAVLPSVLFGPGTSDYMSVAKVGVTASNGSAAETNRTISQVTTAVLSPISLSLAVSDLQLQAQDVGGSPEGSRIGALMNLLFEPQSEAGAPVNPAESALQKSITLNSVSESGIDVSATAATPETAQRLADYFSTRVIREVGIRGHEPGLQVLEHARAGLDSADAALTGFQMRHGEEAVARIKDLQLRAREADANITALSQQSAEMKEAIATVSAMKRDDILTKSLPSLPVFAPAEAVRQTYDSAKLALAEVNVDHGPKHPRTIAAQGAVDAARASMLAATRQSLETLKHSESGVTTSLDTQTAERAELQEQLTSLGDAPAELARLETGLDKARRDYLVASEKVGPFARAPYVTATHAEKAELGTARYDSANAGIMAAGGAALGLLLSLFALSFRRPEQTEEEVVLDIAEVDTQIEAVADEKLAVADTIEIEPGVFDDLDLPQESVVEASVAENEDHSLPEVAEQEAANDVPLDERVRQVLMGNLVRPETRSAEPEAFKLPPLLAAALAGEAEHPNAETEDLKILRRELALLKERLRERAGEEEALRKSA